MKKGGGRRKGNKGENDVAKLIVDAFAKFGITAEDCYRTPLSGGHRFAKKGDPGDLVLSRKLRAIFPFAVEAKRGYPKFQLWHLLMPPEYRARFKTWLEDEFIEQAVRQARFMNLCPLVVVRKNHEPAFAMFPTNKFLVPGMPVLPQFFGTMMGLRFKTEAEGQWMVIPFDDFLALWVLSISKEQVAEAEKVDESN